MSLIIVGAGDIGTPLIDIATQSENEVVVSERNKTERTQLPASTTASCSTQTRE